MKASAALRRALELNEWSQTEAAEKSGLAIETISAIITGRTTRPFPKTLGKLKNNIPGFAEALAAGAVLDDERAAV